jgi:hypothetical protein
MITERQKVFRQEYRSRIVGWYDGYIHILIIYATGGAAFYIYVAHIDNVIWLEWLTLPLTFLFTNIFEWAVHRFIMHRPVNIKGLRAIMSDTRSIIISFSPIRKCGSVIQRIGALRCSRPTLSLFSF